MKKLMFGILIFTCTWFTLFLLEPQYVQPGFAKVASLNVKRAMQKMGPMHNYRMVEDRLQVMINGQWLYLRY